ncbi:MAG: glycosyltransferase [Candidatus Methanomethylicaceae archaeon]
MSVWYIYPIFKHFSFSIIGDKHIKYLKNYLHLQSLDENIIPYLDFKTKPKIILHPYFYPLQKFEKIIQKWDKKTDGIIGIDIADSDKLTDYAVKLTEYANALIVPSNFSKNTFLNSGVKKPVFVVPHGVEDEWIDAPKIQIDLFDTPLKKLLEEKAKGKKLLLSFILHSDYRKGLDLLHTIFFNVKKERKDVALVFKGCDGVHFFDNPPNMSITLTNKGWLSESEKMKLFDICDIYLLTSRGGGFELPALEGLTRGLPVIGAKDGSWEDFLPDWCLVESKPSNVVLAGNPIHCGKGVEMIIEKAIDKTLYILDNLDDYQQKIREHINNVIRNNFTWKIIAKKLADIITRY